MDSNPQIAAFLAAFNNPALPGIDLSLERMRLLLAALGHPERRLPPVIHVAGTNGKGSTIAFLAAMLEAAGNRVHRYVSPHLVRFHERILLAGTPVDDATLLSVFTKVAAAAREIPVTFFEATTAAAFLIFAERPADYLLLEVGLGGRLDATNTIEHPLATLLTPIGLDHQEFLGVDIAAIAAEKAGILKPGVPCFVAAQQPAEAMQVIRAAAESLSAPLVIAGSGANYPQPSLCGQHQRYNAALAASAAEYLGVDRASIDAGIHHARWPGRLQKLTRGPLVEGLGNVWLDGAHNRHGAQALATWLEGQPGPRVLIAGMMARKDARAYFDAVRERLEGVICMPVPGHGDSFDEAQLADAARKAGVAEVAVASDLGSAILLAQRYKPATVLVAGSLYLAGEILKTHE